MIAFDCRQLVESPQLLEQLSLCSEFLLFGTEQWKSSDYNLSVGLKSLDASRLWLDLPDDKQQLPPVNDIVNWLNDGIGALVLPISALGVVDGDRFDIKLFADSSSNIPKERLYLRVSLTALSTYLMASPDELNKDPLAKAISGTLIEGLLVEGCSDSHQLAGMHQLMTFNRHLLPPWLKLNILITSTDTPEAGSDYLSAVMRLVKDFDHQIQSFILGSTSLSSTAQQQDCESAAQLAASWIYGLMQSDRPDNLLPTIVVNRQQQALGLVYSSRESLQAALRSGTGVYYSRSRQQLWEKGKTSGATQRLHRIDFDCDRDALRFEVTQLEPGFCHFDTQTCFGPLRGLSATVGTLQSRLERPVEGSYTARLFANADMLHSKLREEAEEICDAKSPEEIAWEAADLFYFTLVKCVQNGVSMADIERQLDKRALRITRRPGNVKPGFTSAATAEEKPVSPPQTPMESKQQAPSSQPAAVVEKLRFDMSVYDQQDINANPLLRDALLQRPIMDTATIMGRVQPIVEDVRSRGDSAVSDYTARFDRVQLKSVVLLPPFPADQLAAVSPQTRSAIDLAFGNIERFHRAQLDTAAAPLQVETTAGVHCSRFHRPIDRVGLYIPGGTAVLPSTAMMLGIPAKVAGCPHITLATPPRPDGTVCPEVLYIAEKIGAERVLIAGGAQAIAALAYGTEKCPKVDKIFGPGNQYVTAAKMLVQNDPRCLVAIDMPAGPSEVLVIADEDANPAFVAADLLSQAEHGPDSQAVLLTVSTSPGRNRQLVESVQQQVRLQAAQLPRREIVAESLSKSFMLCFDSLNDAVNFSNDYAPEHLILHTAKPDELLPGIQNAGSVFLGPFSPESCGDYASGTNHTLPTYGYAKMYSGVNTMSFMKSITAQQLTAQGLQNIGDAVAHLAAVEGLEGHRNAVLIRLQALKQ